MTTGPLWILSWDGAAPWLLRRAVEAGACPNLERLRARGVSAAGSVTDYPDCSTPPGHAILWTGHSAHEHGVTSFRVPSQPPEEHTLLDWTMGFDSRLLLRPPLWVPAVNAGRTATLVHAPLSTPLEPWLPGGRFPLEDPSRLKVLHGYGPMRAGSAVLRGFEHRPARGWKGVPHSLEGARELQWRAKPLSLPVLLLRNDAGEFDRVWIAPERHRGEEGVLVEAGEDAPFSAPLRLGPTCAIAFRLFALSPDGKRGRLFRTEAFEVEGHPRELAEELVEAAGVFPGWGPYRPYGNGDLGAPLRDGAAERRYMEGHRYAMERFEAASRFAVERHPADLMIFYHPGIDELGHLWAAHVQEGEPWFDAAKRDLVWEHFLEAYRLADRHLGALLDALPEDGHLILTSDHGVGGIHRHFLPNVVLRDAGLLNTPKGNPYRIAPERSKALYHPANNSYVFVNTTRYRKGRVDEEEYEEVLEAAREVLAGFLDPDTGQPVLAAVLRTDALPEDSDLRGQGRGDLFLVLKPGYSLGDSLHEKALLPSDLAGHHQQHPGVRALHAIFEAAGPRLASGRSIGVVHHKDVHETARALLDLPPGEGGGAPLTQAYAEDGPR